MEQITEQEIISKYNQLHAVCPKCKSKKYWTTLAKYLVDLNHPEKYRDQNRVHCDNCGWEGITHDLIPE